MVDGVTIGYWVLGTLLMGALLQTLLPNLFSRDFNVFLSKVTIGSILLVASFVGLQLFLKVHNSSYREGFEAKEKTAMELWKEMSDLYQMSEVCALKKRIEARILPVEKGVPPNELTDTQARERTEKYFVKDTSHGSVNCVAFEKVQKAKDIDTFFVTVQELPNTFLIQVYETAQRSNSLLREKVSEIEKSLKKKEGFVDPSVGVCSPEIVEERRKFLREKKLDEAAQRCLLPEEVPFESKEKVATQKVKKLQDTYDAYIRMYPGKPTVDEMLAKAKEMEKKLDQIKKDAESGDLFKGPG